MGRALKAKAEVAVPGKRKRGRPLGSFRRKKTVKADWTKIEDIGMKEEGEWKRRSAQRPEDDEGFAKGRKSERIANKRRRDAEQEQVLEQEEYEARGDHEERD
eukprot:9119261-Heterocapsa_arctica.AAC.1